jgi:hypothetical protein
MSLADGLRPFWNNHEIVEFLGDHFDVMAGATGYCGTRI